MPRLTAGPFRYRFYVDAYLDLAKRFARVAVKQPVISPALSLMYPADEIPGYSRQEFIDDLLNEHEAVERMGGAVGMESNEPRGSRFWIELQEAK